MSKLFFLGRKIIPPALRQRLMGRLELQKVVANTGWLVADYIVQIITNLIVGVWVARYLGPEQRGIMLYASSFVALFVPLSALGLGSILIRELVREPDEKAELMGTVFVFQAASYLLFLPLLVVAILIFRAGEITVQWAVILIGVGNIFSISRIFNFWFQARLQSKYTVWATRIVEFVIAGLKILLIVIKAPLMAFVSIIALQALLYFFAKLSFYAWKGEKIHTWRFNFVKGKAMLRDSWPLAFSLLAVVIYSEIDSVMLGQLMDNQTVGIYGEAARFSKMWYFIPSAIATSVYPVLVRTRQTSSQAQYHRRTQQFFDIMAIIGYVSAIPAALAAPFVITMLYGPAYAESSKVLAILVWTFVFVALRHGMDRWLLVDNYIRYAMWSAVIGAIVNIFLNLWLMPEFGALGAAWATVISSAVSIYLICLLIPQLRPLFRQLALALLIPIRLHTLIPKTKHE